MERNLYGIEPILSIVDREILWVEEKREKLVNELNQKKRFREMILQYKEPELENNGDDNSNVVDHE